MDTRQGSLPGQGPGITSTRGVVLSNIRNTVRSPDVKFWSTHPETHENVLIEVDVGSEVNEGL